MARPKTHGFSITSPALPCAVFFSRAAILECVDEAIRYQNAVSAFRKDGCEFSLWDALTRLGYSSIEIGAVIANPTASLSTGYMAAADARIAA